MSVVSNAHYFSHAHRIYVKALFKRECLEAKAMHYRRRTDFTRLCVEIRADYEDARTLSDPRAIGAWIRDREAMLIKQYSFNPIIYPRMPGGSMYERNMPPPQFTASEWAASDGYREAQRMSYWQMHQLLLRKRSLRQQESDMNEVYKDKVAAAVEEEQRREERREEREEDLWERGGGR